MAAAKQYGLTVPKKQATLPQARLKLFDDSDDEGAAKDTKPTGKESLQQRLKIQTKLEISKALAEDPTVYEYDSIYDDMIEKKKSVWEKKEKDRKPKYIESLLKAAESRKREDERRLERKVQKEREAEGETFKDKDAFVTSAYQLKMQELEEQEAKEKLEAQMEALTEVTKQKDLSGFYRHLYRQTMDPAKVKEEVLVEEKYTNSFSHSNPSTVHERDQTFDFRKSEETPRLSNESDVDISPGVSTKGEDSCSKERSLNSKTSKRNYRNRSSSSHRSCSRSPRKVERSEVASDSSKRRRRSSSSDSRKKDRRARDRDRDSRPSRRDSSHGTGRRDRRKSDDGRRRREREKRRRSRSASSTDGQSGKSSDDASKRHKGKSDRQHAVTDKKANRNEKYNVDEEKIKEEDQKKVIDNNTKKTAEEEQKRAEEEKKKAEAKRLEVFAKRNTAHAVTDAKERYLARKRAAEALRQAFSQPPES